jgi:hypothetical protein
LKFIDIYKYHEVLRSSEKSCILIIEQNKHNNMAETFNIPTWLAESTELNWNDKALYSVYYYFTFIGDKHVCKLTNKTLGERLGMADSTLRDAKRRLIDKGYIKTNGGIAVTALVTSKPVGIQQVDMPILSKESVEIQQGGCRNPTGRVSKSNSLDVEIQHHNKENKENKEINQETYNISTFIGDGVPENCEVSSGGEVEVSSSLIEEEIRPTTITTDALVDYISDPEEREGVMRCARYYDVDSTSELNILLTAYRWDRTDILPLCQYLRENMNDEVYQAIYLECKNNDEDLKSLNNFCRSYHFTPSVSV